MSSWIVTYSVPFNLKIQSVNHSFFFLWLLFVFYKIKPNTRKKRSRQILFLRKDLCLIWESQESQEIIKIICFSRNAELPWGERQWKTWNSGSVSVRWQLLFRPMTTQTLKFSVGPSWSLTLCRLPVIMTAFLKFILKFILGNESWGNWNKRCYLQRFGMLKSEGETHWGQLL